ncbi:hypothetical protein IJ765_01320 [Candidatus Saccharibacteria bacterium]|nr:hypothetical protein [Candidatus Saccharibacteria bacterium]
MKNKKNLIITIISIIISATLIFLLVITLLPKEYDAVKITNESVNLSKIPSEYLTAFRTQLIRHLREQNLTKSDDIDVSIREDTIHTFTEINHSINTTTSAFIVDIDSVKQTYQVKVLNATGDYVGIYTQINCPKVSEMKYPNTECIGRFGDSSKKVEHHLPYETKLASGEKLIIKSIAGSNILQIYLYSCDQKSPKIKETEELVKNWIKEIGDDANLYQLNVRTGYCEGDTI